MKPKDSNKNKTRVHIVERQRESLGEALRRIREEYVERKRGK